MPGNRVLRRLDEAVAEGHLVKIRRRKRWDRLDGVVQARSAKWLLLALVEDAGSAGHVLLRVADVRRVEPAPSSFVQRALELEGHWPLPTLDAVDLSSTRAALRSLAATQPLVGVHYEYDHPDECLIGVPRGFGRRKFSLQDVTPDATWDPVDAVLRYRSVSRVVVGGAYERRLAAVAGPAPA